MAKGIFPSLTGGKFENIIKCTTKNFDKKYPYVYFIKPQYQQAF